VSKLNRIQAILIESKDSQPKVKAMSYSNPKFTVRLIDILQPTDEEFQAIHHQGEKASVAAHRSYAERTKTFQPGGANAEVARKLEALLIQRLHEM